MNYTFTIKRTYETIVNVDAETYYKALIKLSDKDIYSLELEQCCVIEEFVEGEYGLIKNITFRN